MREARFFIDHGAIHDRLTGRHVRTGGNVDGSAEDGIDECCALLNALASSAPACATCGFSEAEHLPVHAGTEVSVVPGVKECVFATEAQPPDAYDSSTHGPSCMCENVCRAEKANALVGQFNELRVRPGHHPPCPAMLDDEAVCTCGQ